MRKASVSALLAPDGALIGLVIGETAGETRSTSWLPGLSSGQRRVYSQPLRFSRYMVVI